MNQEELDDHWIYGVTLKEGNQEPLMTFLTYPQAKAYLDTLDDSYHIIVRGDQQFYGTPGIHQFMH